MKTTQEQVDDLTAKVFRLEAIATRLLKAEKQLAELTRNDSWLADRCKDAADRLAKLESGKAEVQDGGDLLARSMAEVWADVWPKLVKALEPYTRHSGDLTLGLVDCVRGVVGEWSEIRGTVEAYAKNNRVEKLPTVEVVRNLLHAYLGFKRDREAVLSALGASYDDFKSLYDNVYDRHIAAIQARLERDEARAILAKSESDAASLSSEAVGARGEVHRLRASLDSQRDEIGKYHARVAKLEDEIRERTSELSAAQRLIAEAYSIDDDVMVALGDPVKGAEAEELRRGVEDLIKAADSNDGVVSWHALQSLLDRVNARDSNAFLAQREKAPTLPLDREHLGRIVREVWIAWAKEQPNPKPSWLVPWEGLSEPDREVDRRIGKRLAMEGVVVIEGQLERAETEAKNLREKLAAKGAADVDIEAMHDELTAAGWHMRPGHGWSFGPYACGYFKSTKDAYAAMIADRARPTPIDKAALEEGLASIKAAADAPPPAAPESAQELWAAGWHWSYRNGWTSKDHTKPLSTGQAHAVMLADRRRVRGL